MQIDSSGQPEKQNPSIRASCDSLSKVIDSSSASSKHRLQRISTFRGIQIDLNKQDEKHDLSIRLSRDLFPNVIESTAEQPAKHDFPRISILSQI
jgi:hypothetical protein